MSAPNINKSTQVTSTPPVTTNLALDHHPPHFHDIPKARDMRAQRRTLLFSFLIITVFMLVEAVGGVLTHSLALLSDAGHMLSDAAALGATLLAFKIGEKQANQQKTFGYKRFEILVAGANGATLIIIALMIMYEAIGRFTTPQAVASKGMLMIAIMGLLVNLLVAWLLHRGGAAHTHEHSNDNDNAHANNDHPSPKTEPDATHPNQPASSEKNLNMHSAYLHVLGDLLGSVAAIIAALAMLWLGWWWADPVASIIVAVLILISGYRVVKASAHILMEGTPDEISLDAVAQTIQAHASVITVHDLHVWSITSGLHALSCHVVVDGDMRITEASALIHELEHRLEALGIHHTTIQVESIEHPHNRMDAIVCGLDEHHTDGHEHRHTH